MAKAKSPSDLVVEYFLGIKYFENDDGLIVILPEGLKEKSHSLVGDDLNVKMKMDGLKDVEFVGIFSVPRTTKEVLVLQAEDAKGFDN